MNDARRLDILDARIGLKVMAATMAEAKASTERALEGERKAASNRPLPLLYSEQGQRSDDAVMRMERLLRKLEALQAGAEKAAELAAVIIRGEPV